MNERIKQLAEQAGYTDAYYESDDGPFVPAEFDKEKFAELIVRQCGYYADVFESLGCPVDMDPTETKPSDYIKKHFGVEE